MLMGSCQQFQSTQHTPSIEQYQFNPQAFEQIISMLNTAPDHAQSIHALNFAKTHLESCLADVEAIIMNQKQPQCITIHQGHGISQVVRGTPEYALAVLGIIETLDRVSKAMNYCYKTRVSMFTFPIKDWENMATLAQFEQKCTQMGQHMHQVIHPAQNTRPTYLFNRYNKLKENKRPVNATPEASNKVKVGVTRKINKNEKANRRPITKTFKEFAAATLGCKPHGRYTRKR